MEPAAVILYAKMTFEDSRKLTTKAFVALFKYGWIIIAIFSIYVTHIHILKDPRSLTERKSLKKGGLEYRDKLNGKAEK